MSDWMLYHVWGIRGYRTTGVEKLNPQMTLVTLEPLPSVYRCPKCGSKDVIRKGTKSRLLRGTPVGQQGSATQNLGVIWAVWVR